MKYLFVLIVSLSAFAESYVHDKLGRLIRVEYDDGTTVSYTYDRSGNRTSVSVRTSGSAAGKAEAGAASRRLGKRPPAKPGKPMAE